MRDGFSVIDADRHVIEPADLHERYLEPAFRGRVNVVLPGRVGGWFVDGAPVCKPPNTTTSFLDDPHYCEVFRDAVDADFSPASNVRDMDREGVDIGVHFPTVGLYLIWRDDIEPSLSAAICRAYNNWLAEYCSYDRRRLKGVALVPFQDPEEAARELRRAVTELGLVATMIRPNPLLGRLVDDPAYDPVYREAEALGVPVAVHEGSGTALPQVASDRYTAFGRHIVTHPVEMMLACLNVTTEGLLERFPHLKVSYMEAGCGWLPFWLERMDEHWGHHSFKHRRHAAGGRLPSEIFRQQCAISCEAGEKMVPYLAEEFGDSIVMATDYPHSAMVDMFPDRTVGDLVRNAKLSAEAKRKILWDNPARWYGITEAPPRFVTTTEE